MTSGERIWCADQVDRVSDSEWPLRAAQFLKPPALPGDTYLGFDRAGQNGVICSWLGDRAAGLNPALAQACGAHHWRDLPQFAGEVARTLEDRNAQRTHTHRRDCRPRPAAYSAGRLVVHVRDDTGSEFSARSGLIRKARV